MLLFTLALVGTSRGNKNVMASHTTYGDFFSRSKTRHSSHYNPKPSSRTFTRMRDSDTESAYSTHSRSPTGHLTIQDSHPSISVDRSRSVTPIAISLSMAKKQNGWHEMERVGSKTSPSKGSRFSLGSDEYEVDLATPGDHPGGDRRLE